MAIYVCRADEVEQLVQERGIKNVLSIEHPGAQDGKGRAPRLSGANQKILCFWDVETSSNPQDLPSEKDVGEGLEFLDQYGGEDVIIHCKAGKSRSVALALSWLAQQNGIEDAIRVMKEMRTNAAPNIKIIEHADKYYGMGGALLAAVSDDITFTQNREKANGRRAIQAEEFYRLNPEKRGPSETSTNNTFDLF